MPRGRPRIGVPVAESTTEELVAIYINKFACMIPGCDYKQHLLDARNIIKIIKEVDIK